LGFWLKILSHLGGGKLGKIAWFTVKTTLKDRLFLLIASLVLVYFFVPVFSYFSMRQLQEISITMSVTLNSFILLVLSVFGGVYTLWRDIERKYTFILLSYPIKRTDYIIGRILGYSFLLFLITTVDFALGAVAIKISSSIYKSTLPILWLNIFCAYYFSLLKYILLLSFGFLYVTFSTSFFTPIFLTIFTYIGGNSIQGVYDYVIKSGSDVPHLIKAVIKVIYYIIPNFSSFDFIPYAAYSLKLSVQDLIITFVYFLIYTSIVLLVASLIFNNKDLT